MQKLRRLLFAKAFRQCSLRQRLALCAVLALLLLSAAYALQYLLGYQPCSLCLKQRLIWWGVLGCLATVSFLPSRLCSPRVLLTAAMTASLLMLANGALGVFHAGGERGWWSLTLLCEGVSFNPDMTLEELRALLLTRKPVACDEPALRVFGLSLSEYSALFSFFVLGWLAHGRVASLRGLGKNPKKRPS